MNAFILTCIIIVFLFLFFISVLRECKNVELAFSDVTSKTDLLKGTKKGTVYLTPYRVKARITFIFYEFFWLVYVVETCYVTSVHSVVALLTHPFPPLNLILWYSCCLCPVTPRTAWAQLCSPIIWWKAAALSSLFLEPTTSKGPCQLRPVVSDSFIVSVLLFFLPWMMYICIFFFMCQAEAPRLWKKTRKTQPQTWS